jgi:hypothetical protein
MSRSKFVRSPTLVLVVPTFVLAPAVLILTCRRSGNAPADRVQNVKTAPFASVTSGVSNHALMVFAPATRLKFTAI